MERKRRGWEVAVCEGECREKEVCQMRAARAEDNCVVPEPGFQYKRVGEGGGLRCGDEACGGSVVKGVSAGLVVRKDLLRVLVMRLMEG
jgi:sphingomyelin phosphodiesterase